MGQLFGHSSHDSSASVSVGHPGSQLSGNAAGAGWSEMALFKGLELELVLAMG